MWKRELVALLNLSSWCLVMVERLFLAVPGGCLLFVIVVFPYHTNLYPGIQFRLPCTPPPGQFFMGAKLFIGTPWMGNEGVLKKILVWAM